MNVAVTAPLDRKRWLASLQRGKDVSDTLKEQMDLAEEQLFKAAKPKAVYRIMKKEDIRRKGVSIEKHLDAGPGYGHGGDFRLRRFAYDRGGLRYFSEADRRGDGWISDVPVQSGIWGLSIGIPADHRSVYRRAAKDRAQCDG